MAGDWIPMRLDLAEDPAVIAIAAATGLDECAVVGRLHKLWSWANKHLADGYAPRVTSEWVDRYVTTPGFAAAMLSAGWLRARSGGIELPNFDRWNSQGAKRRVLTAQRMRKSRDANSDAARVTKTSPEKRREEKRKREPPIPPGGGAERASDEPGSGPPTPDIADGPEPDAEPDRPPTWGEFTAAWCAARLPGHDLPHGIQRTSNRVGHWQARLYDPAWAAQWREAVARAGESARCRGATGDWKLTVDMFLSSPDMLVRILEGEFDDARGNGADRRGRDGGDKPSRYGHLGRRGAGAVPPEPAGGPGADSEAGRTADDLFRPP